MTSSTPTVPAEKPIGELDLWWPRVVPYSRPAPLLATEAQSRDPPDQGRVAMLPAADLFPERSTPYAATLRPNEFRLIDLPAVDAYDSPVHLTLEVYDLDDCPEYETASYTWAGEDEDGTLCKPVYIGPFWHVLLQTKNCWEMLRSARPWRGTRMIWVDAICINQDNVPERSSQVANMGRLYSNCSRTVVYLGPDVVTPMHGKHPRRHRLHELATGAVKPRFADSSGTLKAPPPHQLIDLLERRYFSRIWVIQELLLSQRVSIRVGDVDFWADPAMTTYLEANLPGWKWGDTAAAWVQHMAKGALGIKSLQELLRLTSRSQATDPRDRVFGLLGILPDPSASVKEGGDSDTKSSDSSLSLSSLHADYSLSYQHVFIGLFGYCLINLRQPTILHHALGSGSHRDNYPTWVPDWQSQQTWERLFLHPQANMKRFYQIAQTLNIGEDGHVMPELIASPVDLYDLVGPGREDLTAKHSWYHDAHVDASTGALSIRLTQYIDLSGPITHVTDLDNFGLFAMRRKRFTVFLLCNRRLDRLISAAGSCLLFVLNVDDETLMYLVLQRSLVGGRGTYSLVSTCPQVLIQMPSHRSHNELPILRSLSLEDVQYSLFDQMQEAGEILHGLSFDKHDPGFRELLELQRLFPGVRSGHQILSTLRALYIVLHSDAKNMSETYRLSIFEDAYTADISSNLSPSAKDKILTVSFPTSWRDIWVLYYPDGRFDRPGATYGWSYRLRGQFAWMPAPIPYETYKGVLESREEQWIEVQLSISSALFVLALSPGVKTLMHAVKNVVKSNGIDHVHIWDVLEEMERSKRVSMNLSQSNHYSEADALEFPDSVAGKLEQSRFVGGVYEKHITPDITYRHLKDELGMDGSTVRIIIE
ncbi:unnamed protein product [Clonostachys rosea]|uniref:Heterokaryon incompatibility domain-containing protein n=1 Tax=Bionectria ochroleuca TaxID=29856 RepID=A0ABY6UD99_BIOOC|nr:unnamed protein product [Clonostachys rosea]